ncbi:MAG TPA: hypothetical protein VL463_26920 [Kofleriaceae bacterium]|nr:hypothetical protein [Kofleriaceae bacterium]
MKLSISANARGASPGPRVRASRGSLGSAFGLGPAPLRVGILSLAAAIIVAVAAPSAHAQSQDFASCNKDLAQCDQTTTNCCYRPFDPVANDRAIIIPLDRCHQVVASSGKYAPPSGGTAAPSWCGNAGPYTANDNGMYHAYGLVYRLMQRGIHVYWLINPTKDPPALNVNQNRSTQTYIARDIDFWALAAGATVPTGTTALASCSGTCVPPIQRLNPSTLVPVAGSYTYKQFPVRGSAFVIAPEDRAAFNAFYLHQGVYAGLAGNSFYDFSDVDMYELQVGAKLVYQDFRTVGPNYGLGAAGNGAPVTVRIDYAPPRLARESPAGVSAIWLGLANLDQAADYPACLSGTFTPSDAVFCPTSLTDIQNGALVNGGFQWAWLDNWGDQSPCSTPSELATVAAIETFMTHVPNVRAGGHVVFMDGLIGVMEGCRGHELMGVQNVGLYADNNAPTEPLILRNPANIFMQWGDLPTSFAQGSVTRWKYWGSGAQGYAGGHTSATGTLIRLVTQDAAAAGNTLCAFHIGTPACDVFAKADTADVYDVSAYLRYNDDPENGIAFYMPGNQVNNGPSQLRMILDTLIAMPLATVPQPPSTQITEVTRSSPVVATITGDTSATQFQGSYVVVSPPPSIPVYSTSADAGVFEFPYQKGHYRGLTAGTTNVVFDAATKIPGANPSGCGTYFTANCRTVFTNAATGRNPGRVFFSTGNATTLGPLMAPGMDTVSLNQLISHLLAGHKSNGSWVPALGGVDRSTAAIVETSTTVGAARPTMAYVGATDGMLHAICLSVLGACTQKGQELWAFAPRTILQQLRLNNGSVDGSPKVADVFGDFSGNGFRQWRTVLTFQVGSGSPGVSGYSPAVYAMDITNPANPSILWEYTPPANRGSFELGIGLNLAMGPVLMSGQRRNVTIAETTNGGTGPTGLYVAALDTETGTPIWTWTEAYPTPRTSGHPQVPATAIPGGVAAIDTTGGGNLTSVVVPSLFGEVWILNASDGTSPLGNTPLFTFSSDYHPIGAPPTIYYNRADGNLSVAIASGGYVDPLDTSWAPAPEHQYLVGFSTKATGIALPVSDTGVNAFRYFVIDLGVGTRAYGQAVVSGNEIYVTSDTADINNPLYGVNEIGTGQVTRVNLSSGLIVATQSTATGAAAVDVAQGVVYTGNGAGTQTANYSSSYDANGRATELSNIPRVIRSLWLRTQ